MPNIQEALPISEWIRNSPYKVVPHSWLSSIYHPVVMMSFNFKTKSLLLKEAFFLAMLDVGDNLVVSVKDGVCFIGKHGK